MLVNLIDFWTLLHRNVARTHTHTHMHTLSLFAVLVWVTAVYPVPTVNVAHNSLLAHALRTVVQLKGKGHSMGVGAPAMPRSAASSYNAWFHCFKEPHGKLGGC